MIKGEQESESVTDNMPGANLKLPEFWAKEPSLWFEMQASRAGSCVFPIESMAKMLGIASNHVIGCRQESGRETVAAGAGISSACLAK